MRRSLVLLLVCSAFTVLSSNAETPSKSDIINRARATLGSEKALNGLDTLQLIGSIKPADPQMQPANLLIIARKPSSQRLEIKIGDMVETTIYDKGEACIIRSNLKADASQMRQLTEQELAHVRYSTHQFFNFYRPDFKNGEKVTYEGITTKRGVRSHELKYKYPDGMETIRFFSVKDDTLVAVISENGVESVTNGSQVVEGIKFPESIDYYEDGRKLHTIELSEVKVNEPLSEDIFDIPTADKK